MGNRKALLILDDTANPKDMESVYGSFCSELGQRYPTDNVLFLTSNLRAMEKVSNWQQLVASRCEDVPSPDEDAQIYQALVTEAMQSEDVYVMTQTPDGWGYKPAQVNVDFSLLNEGRIDPRPISP